jgi:hypothetical protein
MKKQTKSYIFSNVPNDGISDNPTLLRITITPMHTKVDFGYSTFNSIYTNGGWIQISPETFMASKNQNRNYKLLNVEGISLSPKKHYFQSLRDWQFYSLYFEPIPLEDGTYEIIEPEFMDDKDEIEAANQVSGENFDFFNIQIEMKNALQIREN